MANLMAAFDVTRVYRYRPDANQAMCDCGWEVNAADSGAQPSATPTATALRQNAIWAGPWS
jgi:hypothetical protein